MADSTYLTAKRTVDARALNRRVFDRFVSELTDFSEAEERSERGEGGRKRAVRILEVGAGTGTMVARLAEWNALPAHTVYRAVDRERTHVECARERVPEWLEAAGYDVEIDEQGDDGNAPGEDDRTGNALADRLWSLHASNGETRLTVSFEVGDAFDVEDEVDTIIACAFLDLVDLPDAVRKLFDLLVEGGLLYAPITFDGVTGFVPTHPLDNRIERYYHRHMELRDQPGGPRAGRRLVESVPEAGGELLAAGGSDWLVRPVDGTYPHDERLVLSHLLSTITGAVSTMVAGEFEPISDELDPADSNADETTAEPLDVADSVFDVDPFDQEALDGWRSLRREQLEAGQLTFLAHNLDVLAASRTK